MFVKIPERVVVRIMVVQHYCSRQPIITAVIERADEVAEILVSDVVGNDRLQHLHRVKGQTKDIARTGMRRTAVGNIHRHRHAVDDLVAVRVYAG